MSTFVERILLGILIIGCGGCIFLLLTQRTDSAILKMETDLNEEIASLEMEPQYFFPRPQVDYPQINKTLSEKKILWKELIPPPPPPKKVDRGPDLPKKLKGVMSSKRRQIGTGDSLRVHIKTPVTPRGEFMSVGDTYKDMTIIAITSKYVEFMVIYKEKEYSHQVKRK